MDFPSEDKFTDSSDFELKLVTSRSDGTGSVPSSFPCLSILSRKIGEVTPKLPSGPSLLNTLLSSCRLGYSPLDTAVPHFTFTVVVPPAKSGSVTVFGVQPGGSVCPGVTVLASPM